MASRTLKFLVLKVLLDSSSQGLQQGRRKYLKLGGAWHFKGTFSLRKGGHF